MNKMEFTAASEDQKTKAQDPSMEDRVMVTYYTDPLCCWSWALEPHWKRMKAEFANSISWEYVMGGMIQDWTSYNDPANGVTRPAQLGPVWMHAGAVAERPIDPSIWHKDPPASSYPSCIAVACAMLQSGTAGELLLDAFRNAAMVQAQNIGRESVIRSIAVHLSEQHQGEFSFSDFQAAWNDGRGAEAFRNDLMRARFMGIGRYPTLTFTRSGSRGIIITGYRPYNVLNNALQHMLEQKIKPDPS